MNDQPFHFCFQHVGDGFYVWMRLFESLRLDLKIKEGFVLCLRNKWSIYWWANDGDWTRAWWIHNPLPWSTWLHPPLPPHRFKSLSTIRSFPNPPPDRYQREAFSYTIVASLLLCFGIRGSKASTSRSFLKKLQTKRLGCSLHWFDFTLLKIKDRGPGRTVKARLVDSKRAASYGFDEQQAPTPIKMKSSKLRLKKRAPIRESHFALAPCIGWAFLFLRTRHPARKGPLL